MNNRGDNPDEMGDKLPSIDFGTRRILTIAVGGKSACAIFDSGAVTCWGLNSYGQLGQGNTINRGNTNNMGATLLNIDLGSGHTAKAISIAEFHACAILDDNSLKCWGENALGQLGLGDTTQRGDNTSEMGVDLPTVNLGDNLTAQSVSMGSRSTCVILNTNKLKCWGDNNYGQLGYDDTYTRGARDGTMGMYLPPVVFLGVLTSTPTSTATKSSTPTKTATSTKSNTRTKTPTSTKSNTKTTTNTKTATSTLTKTNTKTATGTKTNTRTP
jgi:alpha-tubulin suppressor-like RCC1 family protein